MKLLVIDNYDSFVYNLVHIIKELGVKQVDVVKNDRIADGRVNDYDKVLLSPGPGLPVNAGMMPEIISRYGAVKSMLGVCLGHQSIAEMYGGILVNLKYPLHGVSSTVRITERDKLFEGIPSSFTVGHYHSWVVSELLPEAIESLAVDDAGNIMALRHREYDLRGVQFHPESVMTEYGKTIIANWVNS